MMANGPAPLPTKKPGKTFVETRDYRKFANTSRSQRGKFSGPGERERNAGSIRFAYLANRISS